ncbi:MAG: PA4642 family protein [Proteobacteria bacterium]|nr:PA4642 family protein [Pseudomonadota bacterium]
MRVDKAKVVDEIWDDERIKGFLNKPPMGPGADPDFSVLVNAYRGMRPEDFTRFLSYFTAAGRNLNATDHAGRTLLKVIGDHRNSAAFREALQNAGAASS